jgi:tRNA-dependent cyclodipeptide synthase
VFVPISLGNHYYSNCVLTYVLKSFIEGSDSAVIFLCDRLRFISYLIRGINSEIALKNILIQLDQMRRTINGIGAELMPNLRILDWSYLNEDNRYASLLVALHDFINSDFYIDQELERFSISQLRNQEPNGLSDGRHRLALQRQYIIEETTLALFMTEIAGYNKEVYRKGRGFIDMLYEKRGHELKNMTKKRRLEREFISIEESLSSERRLALCGVPSSD